MTTPTTDPETAGAPRKLRRIAITWNERTHTLAGITAEIARTAEVWPQLFENVRTMPGGIELMLRDPAGAPIAHIEAL